MARPKGSKNRINVVPAPDAYFHEGSSSTEAFSHHEPIADEEMAPAELDPPIFWARGALLNVRCTGGDYIVTLYPEEYDARSPERAMRFANPAICQNFVSQWYSRQSHDPRAW